MALRRVSIPSPNYSSRSGADVRLIVLHTAEGARTYEELGNYFKGNVEASSHSGIDDSHVNEIGIYVQRPDKAWTQGGANPVSVSAELCAFAKWTTSEWDKHETMLENCAKWIAEEAAAWDIPIVRLSSSQAQGSGRGVCQHVDLGSWGGGHWDCGGGFPMNDVLELAKKGGSYEEPKTKWYFLQDVGAARQAGERMYYGGWSNQDSRDDKYDNLKRDLGHELRKFKDGDFDGCYLIDNSAFVEEIYGGWTSEAGRNDARRTLEDRLGRTLRPFSEMRTKAQGGVPWNCKNLETP